MRVPNTIQTEQELRDTLDLLHAKSKEGKSFTGILELATNDQTIVTAIHNIKDKLVLGPQGSTEGTSIITCNCLTRRLLDWFGELYRITSHYLYAGFTFRSATGKRDRLEFLLLSIE